MSKTIHPMISSWSMKQIRHFMKIIDLFFFIWTITQALDFKKVLNFYTPSSLSCFTHHFNDLFLHKLVDLKNIEGAIKHKKWMVLIMINKKIFDPLFEIKVDKS